MTDRTLYNHQAKASAEFFTGYWFGTRAFPIIWPPSDETPHPLCEHLKNKYIMECSHKRGGFASFFLRLDEENQQKLIDAYNQGPEYYCKFLDLTEDFPKNTYQHYKGGKYQVIGSALHSETLEPLVVYKPLYLSEQFPKETLWVRPEKMFESNVEVNGNIVPRFKKIQ